jgi:hypothetical protein
LADGVKVVNERNVEALQALIDEWRRERMRMTAAEFLASRGVLVPSTLKDGDLDDIYPADEFDPVLVARELERVAKGEA